MKRARVAYAGAHPRGDAAARRGTLRLADGRVVAEEEVVWLAPFEVGTIVALGLNYADHAKELAFAAQDEPLVFLKGPGSVIGHRGRTRRPADATFMHYECELAVVIGKPARKASRPRRCRTSPATPSPTTTRSATTSRTGTGRTCASRTATAAPCSGPGWSMPPTWPRRRSSRCAPSSTASSPRRATPRDLVFDVPFLIEYLSAFMTLAPGDVILTGTPEGVIDVTVGDEVACEIEGIGRLVNTIAGDAEFGR